MINRFSSLISTLLVTALIFGCSGGGGSSSSATPGATATPSSGTISDPYVYKAWFDEISVAGEKLQSTNDVSDIKGNFTFPDALTAGSTITMRTTAGVMHATPTGVTTKYEGPILTRRVSAELVAAVANGEEVIVTPLTTYAEQLQTAGLALNEDAAVEQILALIGNDLITDKKQLFADPMEAFETDGDNDPTLLQVSMAINVALEVGAELFEETFEKTLVLVKIILPKNEDGSAPSEDQFVAANAIIEVVASSEDPSAIAGGIDATEVVAIIEAVKDLEEGQVIVVDAKGDVDTFDYQDLFDAELSAAKLSLKTVLDSDVFEINEELIDCANKFNQAKSTLELASAIITVTANDEDTLNFFYAFSRVTLLANPLTDSNTENGLNRLSDVLDALETPTAEGTPSGSDLQQFIYQRAGGELANAVLALDQVSEDFNLALTFDGVNTDFDNGDVLYLKSAANAALFQVNLLQALNLNADLKELTEVSDTENDSMQDMLAVTTNGIALKDSLLKTKDATALAAAKEFGILAINGMVEAIAAMEAETDADGQENDFINFYEADELEQDAKITDTIADLGTAIKVLTEATTVEDITIDLSGLFAGTVDLNGLLPTYTDDNPGMFPDATLGGIISGDFDINADEYSDGIPDILQGDMDKFTVPMLAGRTLIGWGDNLDDNTDNQYSYVIQFDPNGEDFTLHAPGTMEAVTGNWKLSDDGQLMTLSTEGSTMATIAFDEGWSDEGDLGFEFTMTSPDGTEIYFEHFLSLESVDFSITNSTLCSLWLVDNPDFWLTLNETTEAGVKTYTVHKTSLDDERLTLHGTWLVNESGQLILTRADDSESIFILTGAYKAHWKQGDVPRILFFTVDGVEKSFEFFDHQN